MAHLLDDEYLSAYAGAVKGRAERAFAKARELTNGAMPISEWASAHEYYGLHRTSCGWVFREWAPNAESLWLVGDFSGWNADPAFEAHRISDAGDWEWKGDAAAISHGQNYRLEIRWDGGRGERIPAYARYVVQDPATNLFCARVNAPEKPYVWKNPIPPKPSVPLIYEAHIGMSGETCGVSSCREFARDILPRIKEDGYNTVQLMAVMEHPYYGSFGYHVSSFFAASSRFGTPEDLKSLVDDAHGLGLRVVMDIVHSHSVKNERDGLSRFDGTDYQYFHSGERGAHPAWDSRCFDYGKTQVIHFLLSNCRFWLDEYRFDGYRFDGVTSMLFKNHGLGEKFTDYSMYFNGSVDEDAWCYLQLANRVVHETRPDAVTIAEDVSGLPGCAAAMDDCGIGFDYRMAMGGPDHWFRLAAEVRDEDWSMGALFHELTNRRREEKTVNYVESHDQALVGGKTFFFQLADAAVYRGMGINQHSEAIDRAVALHKMARLLTFALNGGAYLNFMGNEFGHPEWIDFPREGNGWSYSHARRQWSLADDGNLRFKALGDFDKMMTGLLPHICPSGKTPFGEDPVCLKADEGDKVLAFLRGECLFAFNFNPSESYAGYGVVVPPATSWRHLSDTDEIRFGGQGRIAPGTLHLPSCVDIGGEIVQQIKLYIPARSAVVLKRIGK